MNSSRKRTLFGESASRVVVSVRGDRADALLARAVAAGVAAAASAGPAARAS